MKIAFQGEEGSFTEEAIIKQFSDNCEKIACKELSEVFKKVENNECVVPDVRQMSLLKAVKKIKESGFSHTVHGSGIVYWQFPKPNLIKTCGSTCVIGLN